MQETGSSSNLVKSCPLFYLIQLVPVSSYQSNKKRININLEIKR